MSPGPASVSWTSKQLWEGRSSQLSTETSLRADRAFGLVEARAGPGVLGFRKECVWRACVCVLRTQACTRTREGTRACFSKDPGQACVHVQMCVHT